MKARTVLPRLGLAITLLIVCTRAEGGSNKHGVDLPSDEELFDAMTADPQAIPEHSIKEQRRWPWGPSNPPWVPVNHEGVFTSDKRRQWQMKRFTLEDGRTYGPFGIGGTKFETKAYPHDLPFLRNNYYRAHMIPANFEHYASGGNFHIGESIFRPVPGVLNLIQDKVSAPLRAHGWIPQSPGMSAEVKQGEFLWPPVKLQMGKAGLEMDTTTRQSLFHGTMSKLAEHHAMAPQVWYLTVQRPGAWNQRHIMMTPADSKLFTDLPFRSENSDFWLFHEAMHNKPTPYNPKLSLLGGMFLPKGAENTLTQAGVIRPAFSDVISHIH